MRKIIVSCFFMLSSAMMMAQNVLSQEGQLVSSPDKSLQLRVSLEDGKVYYQIHLNTRQMLSKSQLGFTADIGDFTQSLRFKKFEERDTLIHYSLAHAKKAVVNQKARVADFTFENAQHRLFTINFLVENNDVAFRYSIPRQENDNPKCAVVQSEVSSFRLPSQSTTFLCPQITPMTGWERTKPSYEEEYVADASLSAKSQFGVGYTFPCLFRVGNDGWVLISETGVDAGYCGSRLSDYHAATGYTIAYPQPGENNGNGTAMAGISLPGKTPWRTITVGSTLAPIVETTIPYDCVSEQYEAGEYVKPARYTWSWLIWQDKSINYDDQVKFIDLAAKMGYENVLVDNWWDQNIGRQRMAELSRYAQSKNVHLMLWYSSNGYENDAPQTPRNIMNNSIARKREMKWLKSIGVVGIKVDFFGGDKQETMQLYQDILADANDYGIGVIFHGCTLPRGWEKMFPNYIASEAALASENVYFSEHHADKEGFEMCMHPFSRNAVASFDWGGVMMNKYMDKDNKSRHARKTSNVFEMATAITNQSSINCVEVTPESYPTLSADELEYLKSIPTDWKDVKFIAGYPTRYAVIARQDKMTGKWFVGGINGMDKAITLTVDIPMLANQSVNYYYDSKAYVPGGKSTTARKRIKINKNGKVKLPLQPNGGVILF